MKSKYFITIVTMILLCIIFLFPWVYALSYSFIHILIHFLLSITIFLSLYSSQDTKSKYIWILISTFILGYILLLYNFPFYIIYYFAIIVGVIGVRYQLNTITKVLWVLCILAQSFILIYVRFVPAKTLSICQNMVIYSLFDPLDAENPVYLSNTDRDEIGTIYENTIIIYDMHATPKLLDCLKDKDVDIQDI